MIFCQNSTRWRFLFLLCLLMSGVPINAQAAETEYTSAKLNCALILPAEWTAVESGAPPVLTVTSPQKNVRISIQEQPLPSNDSADIQTERQTQRYDGWINLGDRDGSPQENDKANADTSTTAFYAKTSLEEKSEIRKIIVGEYYFAKDERGYILSIEADQANWLKHEAAIKKIIRSFYIRAPEMTQAKTAPHTIGP